MIAITQLDPGAAPFEQAADLQEQALAEAIASAVAVVAPPPDLTVSQWADSERRLSSEASAEPGQWITARAEYQRGIMDALSSDDVNTVVFMASSQVGKTEILNNTAGFYMHHDPAPMLLVQPTLEIAKAWSKDRLTPMLRDTPALQGLVKDARSRDSDNTVLHKVFPGGHITMAGANSPSSLAARPIRIVMLDEVDRYPASAGAEGDPVGLARKRSTTFWNRKLLIVSSPTIKGASRVEAAYLASDRRRFYVPCPHCDHRQVLVWKQVIWPEGTPEGAEYFCTECGAAWSDAERWSAISRGEWKPAANAVFSGVAGFHLSELYSPWVMLGEMASRFMEAKADPEQLRVFINTALGETWEADGEGVEPDDLMNRATDYAPDELPEGVTVITAGVDVQDDRLEVEIVGWGEGETSWSIEYRILIGDPSAPNVWRDLDDLLATIYTRADGARIRINAACVDTGGHHTQAVYSYCKARTTRRVWPIKGMAGARPIWPRKASKNNKGKVNLYLIGVDAAKERIYSHLAQLDDDLPGYCFFPANDPAYAAEYFEGLTAEKVITKFRNGFPVREWVKTRQRNEPLDCRVYAMAALYGLQPRFDKVEQRLKRQTVTHQEPDQTERQPQPIETAQEAETEDDKPKARKRVPRLRKRQNFVSGWRQ